MFYDCDLNDKIKNNALETKPWTGLPLYLLKKKDDKFKVNLSQFMDVCTLYS